MKKGNKKIDAPKEEAKQAPIVAAPIAEPQLIVEPRHKQYEK
jgi:dolichyl-diphosphooligosaccharide--protein glycosyltransferase